MELGSRHYDFDLSPGQSLEGSFRKAESVVSTTSSISATRNLTPSSRRVFKALKDYARKLNDIHLFTQVIEDWVLENSQADTTNEEQCFRSPFLIDELRTLDFALEGVLFQQLLRMPCSPCASDNLKEDEYLALEDFLHAIADCMWRTFWHKTGSSPYHVSCPRYVGSKFYTVEKAIVRGRLESLCGAALVSKTGSNQQVRWDEVVEFALFKSQIVMENDLQMSSSTICEALFYGIHILLSRTLSNYSTACSDSVFILVLDSKFGGVVKLGGDLGKLELNLDNPYLSIVDWLKSHAEVSVSSVDRIWNKLGNANWRDLGTLQLLLATFHSIVQWNGPPRKSMESLASDHSLRLQKRRIERTLFDRDNALAALKEASLGGVVKLVRRSNNASSLKKQTSRLKLRRGEVLLLEDQEKGQMSFQVHESLQGVNCCSYSVVALEFPSQLLTLYVGDHASRLEPSLEDMSLWYQVQRQTKVLKIFKEHGISCKNLPEIVGCGRILHSGACKKQSPKGRCDHPMCGTPILVSYPVGEPISSIVAHEGPFTAEEAIRCCRDCLEALKSAKLANVQHGDICPDNIIKSDTQEGARGERSSVYVLVSWGRAVLEDRDSCPAVNLHFSSAHALQNGKLCPSSDVESLIYMMYLITGGSMPSEEQVDSIESALQWRQRCWSKRVIQRHLGEVSSVLKAFADYVDSLCGTPYPVDYEIWLNRLDRAVENSEGGGEGEDRGKLIAQAMRIVEGEDIAESSGTCIDEDYVSW